MMQQGQQLTIDPAMGMAGDMFAAALLGLHVPPEEVVRLMEFAAEDIGGATVTVHREIIADSKTAYRVATSLPYDRGGISISEASAVLGKTLKHAQIDEPYAGFATRALGILADAETEAHRLLDAQRPKADNESSPFMLSAQQVEPTHTHRHEAHLHEAQDIIMDVAAAAWGLQYLSVDLGNVRSTKPIMTGRGTIRFSHGVLDVPAPATRAILDGFAIPWSLGPLNFEQLTPTGAAILAALNPTFIPRHEMGQVTGQRGYGLGTKRSDPPNLLMLILPYDSEETDNAGQTKAWHCHVRADD
jgi:uncharacterized protein (DUF111 family)